MTSDAQCATSPQPSPKIRRGGQKDVAPVQVSVVTTRNYSRFEVRSVVATEAFFRPSPTFSETVDFLIFWSLREQKVEHWRRRFCGKQRKSTVSSCGRGFLLSPLPHSVVGEGRVRVPVRFKHHLRHRLPGLPKPSEPGKHVERHNSCALRPRFTVTILLASSCRIGFLE
jgi:hypothetical protein